MFLKLVAYQEKQYLWNLAHPTFDPEHLKDEWSSATPAEALQFARVTRVWLAPHLRLQLLKDLIGIGWHSLAKDTKKYQDDLQNIQKTIPIQTRAFPLESIQSRCYWALRSEQNPEHSIKIEEKNRTWLVSRASINKARSSWLRSLENHPQHQATPAKYHGVQVSKETEQYLRWDRNEGRCTDYNVYIYIYMCIYIYIPILCVYLII